MTAHLLYLNGEGEKGPANCYFGLYEEEWTKDLVGKTSILYYVL